MGCRGAFSSSGHQSSDHSHCHSSRRPEALRVPRHGLYGAGNLLLLHESRFPTPPQLTCSGRHVSGGVRNDSIKE